MGEGTSGLRVAVHGNQTITFVGICRGITIPGFLDGAAGFRPSTVGRRTVCFGFVVLFVYIIYVYVTSKHWLQVSKTDRK